MNLPNIFIVGPSGSGKSTSLRNMPQDSTFIVDCERKGFPFKNSSKFRVAECQTLGEIVAARDKALADPTVKYLVFESFTKYCKILLALSRETNKNYDIFNFYNRAITRMLDELKNNRVYVIVTGIDEIVPLMSADGSNYNVRRIAVQGKEHEGKIELEFTNVLYTELLKSKEGKITYNFRTNGDTVCSAKSSMGMLPLYVENDLFAVIQKIEEYNK